MFDWHEFFETTWRIFGRYFVVLVFWVLATGGAYQMGRVHDQLRPDKSRGLTLDDARFVEHLGLGLSLGVLAVALVFAGSQ